MTMPAVPDKGASFELGKVAQELREEDAYVREGRTARTLIKSPDLRIVLIVLKAGKTMSEHHADTTVVVHTLIGRLQLRLPDRRVDLPGGQLLVLGPGLEHDVHAQDDSTFLLTLGWPSSRGC